MFRQHKTLKTVVSVIVILQFGFLMPLSPVLAEEAQSTSTDNIINYNLDAVPSNIVIGNIGFTSNDSFVTSTELENIQITIPSNEQRVVTTSINLDEINNSVQTEQSNNNAVNVILENKQSADEVFKSLLPLNIIGDSEKIDDSLFEVIDEYTDRAELSDGRLVERHYLAPRPLYTDESGVKRVRPEGWHKFYDDTRSRLTKKEESGYSFSMPVSESNSVEISSGDVEVVKNGEVINSFAPQEPGFGQRREDLEETSRVVTQYAGVYTNIDVNFIDKRQKRTKEIIIKEKISLEDDEKILFWETYKLPLNSTVFIGEREYTGSVRTKSVVQVKMSDGKKFFITPSVIFDSLFDTVEYREMSAQGIEQTVVFDKDQNELKIGLIVEGSYLNDEKRVYPVVIDPSYFTCDTGSCEGDIYLKWLTGKSTWDDGYLIMGYDYASGVGVCSPAGDASRHTVLKFNFSGATLNTDIQSAVVHLKKYNTNGCGEYDNGNIGFKPKKITKSWALASDITYTYVRSTLQSGGGITYLNQDSPCTDCQFTLDSTMVKNWINGVEGNYGVLIEPTDNFPSGTTVPASWSSKQKLFWFYSSNNTTNSNYDPYLEIDYVVQSPDLSIYSKSLSKTTVTPNESITGYVRVQNLGTGSAGASTVGYYYSADSNCTTGDVPLATDGVDPLTAGTISTEENAPLVIPNNAETGTRYICFIADINGSITEEYENNNTSFVAITVSDPTPVDPLEPNNSSGQAYNIGTNTSYSNNNLYLTANDQDWFKFSYNGSYYYFKVKGLNGSDIGKYGVSFNRAGSVVIIETTQVDIDVDTYLELYGTNGTSLLAADDDDGNGAFSKITYDLNPNQPPNTCSLTSPSNGSADQNTSLTLDWSCSDPDGSILNYYLEIDDASNFSSPFYSEWTGNANSNFDAINLNYSTTYYWRVKAQDDDNAEGAYNSPAWYFSIKNQPSPGGGSSCGANCSPNNNIDGDTQVETEEANEGLSDNIPNVSPVDQSSNKENSNQNDDNGADPVNLRTGSFELTQTDLVLQGRGENIDFTRYYNSKTEKNARFGVGWKYSYNQYYFKDSVTGKVVVYKGGNIANIFEHDGLKYVSPGQTDKLYPDDAGVYLILEKVDGTKYYYSTKLTDSMGLLQKISDTNGNETQFNYAERRAVDMLSQVVDSSGRLVVFEYGDVSNDKRWDKITKLTYSTGDPNTKTTVDYVYEDLSGVVVLKEVKRTRVFDGQSEIQTDKFTYAKYGASDIYRLATQEDARGTILYNTYDSEGRTTVQKEYNPIVDAVATSRLIWTLEYLGEDPSVVGDNYCTLVKNYSDEINHVDQKFCYNSDHLKVYEYNNGDKVVYTRDVNGMITDVIRDNGAEGQAKTQYEYDSQKRVTKEILPDTNIYHTETWYTYGAFNRVENKYIYVWDLGEDYTVPNANLTKHTSYSINPLNGNILSITYPDNITESFTYDIYGNRLTYTDKNGKITTYNYDVGGNYVLSETKQVTLPDGSGQTITRSYEYDEYGNKIKYTSPRNFEFTYVYDTKGNLRQETNPLGDSKIYEYDIENHRTDMYDELSRHTQFVYNKDIGASLISEKKYSLDNGHVITVNTAYDNLGRPITNYDAKGNVVQTLYDSYGRSFKSIGVSKTTEYLYYVNGDIQFEYEYINGSSLANWLRKTKYLYDERNNLVETRQYSTDSNYISTFNEYDGFDRITKITDANGNTTRKFYDSNDRLVTEVNAVDNTTTYSYDKNSNKIGVKQPRCLVNVNYCNSDGYSISYVYDEANRLIKQKNADNKVTLFFYNQDSQVTKIVDRQNVDGTSNTRVKQFEYDALGRKIMEKDADNATIVYSYDKVGNLKTMTDQKGRVTTFVYDDFNRLVQEKDPGQNITTYTHDDNGNKTSVTDPGAVVVTTNYEYDSSNKLHKVVDANGDYREFTYDIFGNKTNEKNKKGFNTSFVYDKLGRLTSETNTLGASTAYTFDNNGNQLSVTIGGNKITSYLYDELNQIKQITYPSDKIEKWTYDANGNKSAYTDGNNQVISFDYDKLDRLTAKHLPGNIFTVEYIYDNWNNLTHLSDESGTTDYVYDNLNRVTNESKLLVGLDTNKTIGRAYDSDGQIKIITDAVGRVFNYDYNNRSFLDKVTYLGQTLASYTYTAYGKVDKIVFANGVTTNYLYDVLNRTTEIKTWNASGTLFLQNFQYDAESNRVTLIENGIRTTTYDYDSLDQLTGVDYKDVNGVGNDLSYTYDPSGNRTALVSPTAAVSYTFNSNTNELATVSYSNGRLVIASEYDGNGSVTKETYTRLGLAIKEITNTWDTQNRLAGITYHALNTPAFMPILPDNTMSFVYDDFGNRAMKQSNNEKVYYLNDGLTVLNELSIFGGVTKTLVNNVAEIDKNGIITYIHQDVLGSTVLLTNAQGQKVGEYEYEPFGALIGYDGTQETDYLYTGQELDTESELYYYNARYYNPAIGRFISRDPMLGREGNILTRNGYVYVLNNPLKYTDPSGEEEYGCFTCYDVTSDLIWKLKKNGREMEAEYNNDLLKYYDALQVADDISWWNPGEKIAAEISASAVYESERASTYLVFYNHVKPTESGGDWDYKTENFRRFGHDHFSIANVDSNDIDYETCGNINFGYTGRAAGIPKNILLTGAGMAQLMPKRNAHGEWQINSETDWWRSYFDDPKDQRMIRVGMTLYDRYGLNIDEKKLGQTLQWYVKDGGFYLSP